MAYLASRAQGGLQQLPQPLVFQIIIDELSISPAAGNARFAEDVQLLRDVRLPPPQDGLQATDTGLATSQLVDDAQPGWVGEYPEHAGCLQVLVSLCHDQPLSQAKAPLPVVPRRLGRVHRGENNIETRRRIPERQAVGRLTTGGEAAHA